MNATVVIYSPAVRREDTATSPEVSNANSAAGNNLGSCSQGEGGIHSVSTNLSQVSDQIIRKYRAERSCRSPHASQCQGWHDRVDTDRRTLLLAGQRSLLPPVPLIALIWHSHCLHRQIPSPFLALQSFAWAFQVPASLIFHALLILLSGERLGCAFIPVVLVRKMCCILIGSGKSSEV